MKIIDTHAHLDRCRVFDMEVTEDALIKAMNSNNIDITIVQPFPGAFNAVKVHDDIFKLAQKYEGKIYGLVSINPHQEEDIVSKEIDRCVKRFNFVGVKIHTIGHALHPSSKDAGVLWRAAVKHRIPVMVHTGPGIPFALPSNVAPKAEEYPEVQIVIAHAGFGLFSGEALDVAKKYDNVYLEISWAPTYDVEAMAEQIPDKVMFGADLPSNVAVEMAKVKAAGLSEDVQEKIFYKNALGVFKKIEI